MGHAVRVCTIHNMTNHHLRIRNGENNNEVSFDPHTHKNVNIGNYPWVDHSQDMNKMITVQFDNQFKFGVWQSKGNHFYSTYHRDMGHMWATKKIKSNEGACSMKIYDNRITSEQEELEELADEMDFELEMMEDLMNLI